MIFAIYGLGLAAIFAVFALLYRHAYSAREELDLNEVEQYDTRETMRLYFANAGLGVVVGVNGLITGFKSETPLENALTLGFAAIEVITAIFLIRFRATRKTRRARFLDSLTAPPSTEHLPLHAN
jgi:dipeptide/tripeptide permease